MIQVEHLSKNYDGHWALRDVSFHVRAGDIYGFIGPNGAGKTTAIRILCTLLDPTSGSVRVDGKDIIADVDQVRRLVGYMPDNFGVYERITVWEYLDFFAAAYGVERRKRSGVIEGIMELTDLGGLRERLTAELSKGMRQRLCLAKTLVHDTRVLILDEPAAGLDPRARIELREMIGRLAVHGKTVLISSHILTELGEMCHRVGIIERGQLLAVGSVEEIMASSKTRSEVRLRTLHNLDGLMAWLARRPDVADVDMRNEQVTLTHDGGPEEQASLLRQLVTDGFDVVEFASTTKSLEDAFMHVTEGRLQ